MRPQLVKSVQASQLAAELGLPCEGEDVAIALVTPLSAAVPHALTFSSRVMPAALPAGTCVIAREQPPSGAWIRSAEPRLDFIKALLVLERLGPFTRATEEAQIHPTAVIAPAPKTSTRSPPATAPVTPTSQGTTNDEDQ